MSYRDWQVGDRVVCVNGGPWPGYRGTQTLPTVGSVYTIRRITPYTWVHGENGLGVWVNEISRDFPYAASRFRKVQPRKTSIEVFKRILLNPTIPVKEEA